MALAETAKLIVDLSLQGNFLRQTKTIQSSLGKLDAKLDQTESRAFRAGQQIGTGIKNAAAIAAVGIAALATQVGAGLKQLADLEELAGQTEAAIASTGGVAGQTAADVRRLAEEYENLNAIFDDKVIQSGENLLLTFTNIRKEAFEPALEAALDLSVAMDQDLNTSVLQLGKALNDPIRGLTALRRVGVQFTKDQEEQIKALVESNDLYGAQRVILEELGREFGGRFRKQGQSAKGTIAGIGDAVEDLQKALATALFPTVQKVLPRLRDLLASPEFTKGAEDLGKAIAGLFSDENIAAGADILKSAIATAREAAPVVAEAAKAMAGIVSTAVSVFRSLPPEIQKLAIGAFAINKLTGGLVTNVAGGLISAVLKQLVSGVVNVNGAVVNVNGAVGAGLPAAGGAAATAGGIGAAGLAGVGAIGVTFVGGAALSMRSIFDAMEQNNRLAARGLTNDEIIAQRYYNANRADQDRIFKQLHGRIPPREVFDSGNAKLAAGNAKMDAAAAQRERQFAGEIAESRRASQQQYNAAERNRIATIDGALKQSAATMAGAAIAAAAARAGGERARLGGVEAAAAIRNKDLSVNVSIRNVVSAQNKVNTIYRTQS